jgi:hypothetical protein
LTEAVEIPITSFMRLKDQLLVLARAYLAATGLKTTTLSWRLFSDTNKLDAILAGKDLQVGRFENAMVWFAANWPEDAPWPEMVERPAQAA